MKEKQGRKRSKKTLLNKLTLTRNERWKENPTEIRGSLLLDKENI